jgi:hypothetical protein
VNWQPPGIERAGKPTKPSDHIMVKDIMSSDKSRNRRQEQCIEDFFTPADDRFMMIL